MPEILNLKIKPRVGGYARSVETVEQILNAALKVLTHEGYAALSIRRVASECGIRQGNLSYHFPTKNDLVKGLLEAILDGYMDRAVDMDRLTPGDRQNYVYGLVRVLRDTQSFQSTRLFPELWAMASHDPEVGLWLQDFYRRARAPAIAGVRRLNPRLDEEDAETIVLFFSSLVEGSSIFAGFDKPYADRMPDFVVLAIEAYAHLVETITPERLRSLRQEWRDGPSDPAWVPASLETPSPGRSK